MVAGTSGGRGSLNPASAARRKALENAMQLATNGSPSAAVFCGGGGRQLKADSGTQTVRDERWYDDDDEMMPMPGRLELNPRSSSVGVGVGAEDDEDMGGEGEDQRGMTEEERFFGSSPTITRGIMTPPSSTLRPRPGREMVHEEDGDDMDMDDDGSVVGVNKGKGRARASESIVEDDLEGFNWDEFQAPVSAVFILEFSCNESLCLDGFRKQMSLSSGNTSTSMPHTHPGTGSLESPVSNHILFQQANSQQLSDFHTNDGPQFGASTDQLTGAEVDMMLQRMQSIPEAMQRLEGEKMELQRREAAKTRRIKSLESEVDRCVGPPYNSFASILMSWVV